MTEDATAAFTRWARQAQTAHGDPPVSFTPLALVRARQMFEGGTPHQDCVPQLRAEGLLE